MKFTAVLFWVGVLSSQFSHSADQCTAGPGVPRQAHISEGIQSLANGDCKQVLETWERVWVSRLQSEGFFVDRAGYCVQSQLRADLYFNMITEPFQLADLSRFHSVLAELESLSENGLKFKFLRIEEVTDHQMLSVRAKNTSEKQKPRYRFEITVPKASMIDYYCSLTEENLEFRVAHPKTFMGTLHMRWPLMPWSDFSKSVDPDVTIISDHRPKMVIEDRTDKESWVGMGNIRQCYDPETPCFE